MPLEPFNASDALTFGVELELQLVSLSDLDLTPASVDVLDLLKRKPFPRQRGARDHREHDRD